MTQSSTDVPESAKETSLPRRDWILLPLLGLLTLVLMAGSTELIARRMFTDLNTVGEDCLVRLDQGARVRGISNSVCWEKLPEGNLTKYHFNSSGFRNDFDFAPKSPGTYRIVVIGTSVAAGFRVPQEQTLGTLLPAELTRRTGRKVELYDEGLPWQTQQMIAHNFSDVLMTKPDMVLWILTPLDIEWKPAENSHESNYRSFSFLAKAWYRIKSALDTKSSSTGLADAFSHTRTAVLFKHFLYKSQSQYLKYSFMKTDYEIGFLKSEPSAEWQKRLEEFDSSAAILEGKARDAGIPLAAVLVPDRTQAAMISMMGEWPKGFDPYKLDSELGSIIESHGGIHIDILPDFRAVPNPQLGFFAMDGHPNADGHAMISNMLAKELTNGIIPALRAATNPRTELEQGN
jgi:hypothetical protein